MTKIILADIGARGGIDERWHPYGDHVEAIAFDADPVECERLNGLEFPYKIQFLPYALGATDGESATLNICRKPGCSSLLEPNMDLCDQFHYAPNMHVVERLPMELARLDTVCSIQPDVMKIDTQGTELDILKGAGNLLQGTIAVELEVEFVEQYKGQALFSDVDGFMRSQGFMLRGIRRTYWRNRADYLHANGGQLIHGDVLYIRPDKIDCPKGHIILAAYRQYDLLAHFGIQNLIPKRSLFTRAVTKLLSGYPNRELRRLVDKFRPIAATDWHDPDFF